MERTAASRRPTRTEGADRAQIGVSVLHGFTSTPQSVAPLAEALLEAGFGVDLPLLPGHGTDWQDLARTPHGRILRAAVASWDRLAARHRAVAVVGLSMGGALALHVAARRGALAVAAVNPGLKLKPGTGIAARLLRPVVPTVAGVAGDIAREGVEEIAYARTPVRGVVEVDRLAAVVRGELALITCPVLLARSASDSVLPTSAADTLVNKARRAPVEQLLLPRSRHVATLDHDADLLADRTIDLIDRADADRRRRSRTTTLQTIRQTTPEPEQT